MPFLFILFISFSFTQYYDLEISGTGQYYLMVFQETINLEPGCEIGIFDEQAIMNDGDCETEYGELLVGSGMWNGTQLNLTAIGSIDFCDVGGEQRAGYIEDNEITIRVYNHNDMIEYTASFLTFDGIEPSFISGFVTAISEISLEDIYAYNSINNHDLIKDFNFKRIYPNPANPVINVDYEISYVKDLQMSIFSINGKLIYENQSPLINLGNNSIQIELSDYPSGFYFLKMESENQNVLQKFVVLK